MNAQQRRAAGRAIIATVAHLQAKPGDVLVIQTPKPMCALEADIARRAFSKAMPGVAIMIAPMGVKFSVIEQESRKAL